MPLTDIFLVIRWWGTLFLIGAAAYPMARRMFAGWYDQGYFFAKAVGLSSVTWIVYVLGTAKISPFAPLSIGASIISVFLLGVFLQGRSAGPKLPLQRKVMVICFEEFVFFAALLFWSFIKAHEPSIRGLEKFMDYGFMQSILNSTQFPPADMWYPPYPINYYYFGHLVTALLTKLSGLDLAMTFNLMLATIFALCLTMSFSIGYQLVLSSPLDFAQGKQFTVHRKKFVALLGGGLTAFLVTLAGNMQTIYAFTRGYTGEDVKPFWQLFWPAGEFISKVGEGMNLYWYANATRFIPFTIHEFPSYSFVVSDVHGHVLSIPFVLLAIGLLITMFGTSVDREGNYGWLHLGFYGLLMGILLMTNALDGPIYLGLFLVLFIIHNSKFIIQWRRYWKQLISQIGAVLVVAGLASLPFLAHFKSFVNGVAVNCPLPFFANTKLGPLLFEGVEKCQRSPFWMLWLLWGFFWFCGIAFLLMKFRNASSLRDIVSVWSKKITHIDRLLVVFFVFSFALVIFPEFFYFKDIYPQHFRSNTMFKLGYDAFILYSILSGYVITIACARPSMRGRDGSAWRRRLFLLFLAPQLFLVSIYPLFSVRSYFGGLTRYEGLYGLTWLFREYPDDFAAIQWLKNQVISHQSPVIRTSESGRLKADSSFSLVEADGDSYTDYERFSVFTGIATPIGWAVHEWLWRGSYDVVSPRREDVRVIYESEDIDETWELFRKYNVRYVIVGTLERKKYTALNEEKFRVTGTEIFRSGETVIYEVTER